MHRQESDGLGKLPWQRWDFRSLAHEPWQEGKRKDRDCWSRYGLPLRPALVYMLSQAALARSEKASWPLSSLLPYREKALPIYHDAKIHPDMKAACGVLGRGKAQGIKSK